MYIPLRSRLFKLKCKGPDLKLIDVIEGRCTREELHQSFIKFQQDQQALINEMRKTNRFDFKGLVHD